jgi:hypothetical protein
MNDDRLNLVKSKLKLWPYVILYVLEIQFATMREKERAEPCEMKLPERI